MNILVFGNGVMANLVKKMETEKDKVLALIDTTKDVNFDKDFDVIIDFSHHNATKKMLDFAIEKNKGILIATTGHSEEEIEMIKEASKKIPIIKMSNTSLGINVMKKIIREATKLLEDFDIEILEAHHNRKIDAPSGTAISLAKEIVKERELKIVTERNGKREKNELGIHSIRAGNIVGEHTVIYAGDEEMIEIKHTAFSRRIFAQGAIKIARKLLEMENGIYIG